MLSLWQQMYLTEKTTHIFHYIMHSTCVNHEPSLVTPDTLNLRARMNRFRCVRVPAMMSPCGWVHAWVCWLPNQANKRDTHSRTYTSRRPGHVPNWSTHTRSLANAHTMLWHLTPDSAHTHTLTYTRDRELFAIRNWIDRMQIVPVRIMPIPISAHQFMSAVT